MRFLIPLKSGIIILTIFCVLSCTKKGDGFVSLFDGKTLNGWTFYEVVDRKALNHLLEPGKDDKYWRAIDGMIENTGKGKGSLIWTEKEYKDFILKIDWRLPGEPVQKDRPIVLYNADYALDENGKRITSKVMDSGDSGIILRGYTRAQVNIWSNPMGSGNIHGYMVKDMGLPQEIRRAVIPIKNIDNPLGEWNTFIITMKGEFVTVVLNDVTIIQNARLPEVPESGPIGLQQHTPSKNAVKPFPVQFRNIFIKQL